MLIQKIQRSKLFQSLVRSQAAKRATAVKTRNPLEAQRQIFKDLLKSASMTRFGKAYGFSGLADGSFDDAYNDFRGSVPIRSYSDFMRDFFYCDSPGQQAGRAAPHLDNITWPGTIPMYCETSGTTAPTKFIPFSRQMFAENRRAALDMMACYLAANPASPILDGKILYMSGPTTLAKTDLGAWTGDMSALTLRFRPGYLRHFVEPGPAISALPWDQKLQAMAELLLRDDRIRAISGVPPWIILLLKRCIEIGEKPLSELLPNLELIIHGGTSMKPYHSEFGKVFGGILPNFLELLPSSEAFMAFQHFGETQMRLSPFYGVFFEFVRFEDLDDSGMPLTDAVAIPLEQVEVDQRYAVILSTCSGLWRYHIGDTIRFTSLSPHFIEFTGRDRFLDKLEEKVTQGEVEQAVAELNQIIGWNVREFMVGSDVSARRHQWILAVQGECLDVECAKNKLDATLRHLNADYAAFREQGRINRPDVVCVPEDGIYNWSQEQRGKLGGQSKIPHIDPTQDSSMIQGLLKYCTM